MSEWVCPHCPYPQYESKILEIQGLNRLYAFPCVPKFQNGKKVILDSGAYGLSQAGKKMSVGYMQKLSDYYQKHYREGITFCVAPDEWLNPTQTMYNFRLWRKHKFFEKIVPVIQAEKRDMLDLDHMKYQADFYRPYSDVIFVSNNNLTANTAKYLKIEKIFEYCKSLGYEWIHFLGAGWDLEDVKKWSEMRYLDSFDSIAYYTAKDEKVFGGANAFENAERIIECLKT